MAFLVLHQHFFQREFAIFVGRTHFEITGEYGDELHGEAIACYDLLGRGCLREEARYEDKNRKQGADWPVYE